MSLSLRSTPTADEIRRIVRWLGLPGAKAGLLQSKSLNIEALADTARALGLSINRNLSRPELVDLIIKTANKRIDKPLSDLFQMSQEALMAYFNEIEPTTEELLDLLQSLDVNPGKEGHRRLMELAVRELNETGRFMRIAGNRRPSEP